MGYQDWYTGARENHLSSDVIDGTRSQEKQRVLQVPWRQRYPLSFTGVRRYRISQGGLRLLFYEGHIVEMDNVLPRVTETAGNFGERKPVTQGQPAVAL